MLGGKKFLITKQDKMNFQNKLLSIFVCKILGLIGG